MRLHFLGASRTVTGSQYLLELPQGTCLVDCGLYQGHDALVEAAQGQFAFDPAKLDCVLLTHAHIDHSGMLPRLWKKGFRGKIHATSATADLCQVMLADSAKIQEEDAAWELRKWRQGKQATPPPAPLYTAADAAGVMGHFAPLEYDANVAVLDGVSVRWADAGHILGAASLEVWAQEGEAGRKLVFSGDIGNPGRPILRDPTLLDSADFVVMESTYGDRLHPSYDETAEKLAAAINTAVRAKGHVIIPAFAVGRTQEVLFHLDQLIEAKKVPGLPVFVDSPLASKATKVFEAHRECYDTESLRMLAGGDNPIRFPELKFTDSAEQSRRLNSLERSVIIIAASGMCNAGRVRHHLHHHLDHGNDIILFVGFQAQGTLGRQLVDGSQSVQLFGRRHRVRARIVSVRGLSAHADRDGLLSWARSIEGTRTMFVTHGEPQSAFAFSDLLGSELGRTTCVPQVGDSVDLLDEGELAELHRRTRSDRAAFALAPSREQHDSVPRGEQ